jgi:hypothetical protein
MIIIGKLPESIGKSKVIEFLVLIKYHLFMETKLDIIEYVDIIIGKPNHKNGYSTDKLAFFFQRNSDFARFVANTNEEDEVQINEIFARVTESLHFHVYLQRKVARHLKGVFTSDQLCCIFQAFNGILVRNDDRSDISIKESLYDYINHEGKGRCDLGDVDAFKAKIEAINLFEFEIFINLVLEAWDIEVGNAIGRLHNYLMSD